MASSSSRCCSSTGAAAGLPNEGTSMGIELSDSFEVIDPRFRQLTLLYVRVEKLYTGCRWAEGPAWFGAGRYLVWSDIPNDRVMRWDETDGSVSVFMQPAMNSNGHSV